MSWDIKCWFKSIHLCHWRCNSCLPLNCPSPNSSLLDLSKYFANSLYKASPKPIKRSSNPLLRLALDLFFWFDYVQGDFQSAAHCPAEEAEDEPERRGPCLLVLLWLGVAFSESIERGWAKGICKNHQTMFLLLELSWTNDANVSSASSSLWI